MGLLRYLVSLTSNRYSAPYFYDFCVDKPLQIACLSNLLLQEKVLKQRVLSSNLYQILQ